MSLILDALNKADRDRDSSGAVPDLKTLHGGGSGGRGSNRWLLASIGIIIALLLLVVALTLAWLRTPASTTPSGAPSQAEQQELPRRQLSGNDLNSGEGSQVQAFANAVPPTQSQASARSQVDEKENLHSQQKGITGTESDTGVAVADQPSLTEVSPEVRALYQVQYGEVQIVEPTVRPAATETASRQTSIDEELARALWDESRIKPAPRVPSREQVIKPEPVVEPEIDSPEGADFESTLAALDDVLFLHQLPVALQNQIPTLMYAQHSFADQTVTINKKPFRVGDNIGKSIVVERILADGVLLNFEGEQFKLAALSSWVNY